MKARSLLVVLLGLTLLMSCASAPPAELSRARELYQRASTSAAARYSPVQLGSAHEALLLAEAYFREEGDSERSRDFVYIALSRLKLALVTTEIVAEHGFRRYALARNTTF